MESNLILGVEDKMEYISLMRELIRLKEQSGTGLTSQNTNKKKKNFISGTIMSIVFLTCFVLILAMAFYSFYVLYFAIQKRFPPPYT